MALEGYQSKAELQKIVAANQGVLETQTQKLQSLEETVEELKKKLSTERGVAATQRKEHRTEVRKLKARHTRAQKEAATAESTFKVVIKDLEATITQKTASYKNLSDVYGDVTADLRAQRMISRKYHSTIYNVLHLSRWQRLVLAWSRKSLTLALSIDEVPNTK